MLVHTYIYSHTLCTCTSDRRFLLLVEFGIKSGGSHLTLTFLYPFHLTTHWDARSVTQLHPNTFAPENLSPNQPPISCLQYCAPAWLPSASHPHTHGKEGSRTSASHSSAITEWIDYVCVKCERRLCGFNSLCLAYRFQSCNIAFL